MNLLEKLNNARSFKQAQYHPSQADCASRWVGPEGVTEGYSDGYLAGEELVVTTKRMRVNERCSEEARGLGRIEFVYHLDGIRRISIPGQYDVELRRPTFFAYVQQVGTRKISTWNDGESETSLGLGFNPKSPPDVVRQAATQIDWLQDLLLSQGAGFERVELPLTPDMELTARSMVAPKLHRSLLRSYMSAKAEELFCLTFETMIRLKNDTESADNDLQAKAARARRIIEGETCGKVPVETIASMLDVSQRVLAQAFQQKYGVSIHKFGAMVRMSHSEYLLRSTKMPLKQIAFEAGYNHVSNFCIAFKRQYGVTPSSIRHGESQLTN